MDKNNVTTRRKLAKQARRSGYFQPTEYTMWITCPECGDKVHAEYHPSATGNRMAQLDAFVVLHLEDCLEERLGRAS